jgi:hypothetical protein
VQPGGSTIIRRIVVFHQWKGRKKDYVADFPVFEDGSPFYREISAQLAKEAWEFASDGDDQKDGGVGFGGQTVHIDFCTTDLVSVAIRAVATGGSTSTWTITHNFVNDAGHAREFSLAELFIPGSGWEEKLSDFCIIDLLRQYGPYDPGADPKLNSAQEPNDRFAPFGVMDGTVRRFTHEQLSAFNLNAAGLEIELSSLAVGGGKGADCRVAIPWAELRDYLRPEGPARFLPELAVSQIRSNFAIR